MDKNIKKRYFVFFIPVVCLRVNVGLCFIRPLKKKKKKINNNNNNNTTKKKKGAICHAPFRMCSTCNQSDLSALSRQTVAPFFAHGT